MRIAAYGSKSPSTKPEDISCEWWKEFDISDLPVEKIAYKVEDEQEFRARDDRQFAASIQGKKVKEPFVVSFQNLDALRQFLTPQRQLLYRVLRRKEFDSVYALSKFMKREYKAIVEDLKVLKELGLIRFETSIHNGRARSSPVLTHKKFTIEFG